MRVDLGNALATTATPGVPREALERLDERVARCHERIQAGRADDAFGYAALNLPETVDADAIRETVAPFADAEAVLTVGIGGSALGAHTVVSALGADRPAPVLDNVDPAHVERVLADLPLAETAVNVVSRSGTTAETVENFRAVRAAMDDAGVDWTERTFVTTGPDGPLRERAERHGLPVLDVPPGVPGRFSALSPVGLAVPAILGHDVEALLAGGRDVALGESLFDAPAYAYGAAAYALDLRGAGTNVMMPYAESLEAFAEWFAQLWAESLGKDGLGQTPVRALGATDQHSQLQLYRSGPRDKVVTLVRPRERDATAEYTDAVGDLLDAEFRATEASLAAAERPSVRVELERVDARGLGRLLYAMEAACVLAGELYEVETFTQPAVEWGKEAARAVLDDERDAPAELSEKETLVVD